MAAMKKGVFCAFSAILLFLQAWDGPSPVHAAATLLPNGEQCFQATAPTSGGLSGPLTTLGNITGGSGYVNGSYPNVPLTGGSGFGATATITVTGNSVSSISITNPGSHYAIGDTLSAATASLGGSGSGFSVPVNAVSTTGTGMLGLLGTITGGSGGTAGTYAGVALTGGSGSGATANITVSGGTVTAVVILNPGSAYAVADTLSAASGSIGGVTGFSVPVSSVAINQSLAGGSVAMYIPNTNTFKQTWQNAGQTVLNTNPITLDQNGCATIYGTGSYRQVLMDALGDIVWDKLTTDTSAQQNTFWAGIAGGTPNAITLTDPGFNATDGSIINFTALFSNTGATTINPSGFGNITVEKDTTNGPQGLGGGEIVASNPISVIYRSTDNAFHILNSVIVNNTNQCLLITAFGGAGNNSTDNTTPFINAFNALTGNGGCIYFQPGKYRFNSQPTINLPSGIFSFQIRGSGQDNTILTWPNVNGGIVFNYGGIGSSVHVSDISFTTGVAAGGDAVKLNLSSSIINAANGAISDITRVTMRGDDGYAASDYWSNGVNIANVSNVQFDMFSVTGSSASSGTGINLVGLPASMTFGVQYNIAKSNLQNLSTGIFYGNYIQGLTVDQTNFTHDASGIGSAGAEVGLAQLAVTNSQFNMDNTTGGNGIVTSSPIFSVTFTNNLVLVNGTNPIGLALNQTSITTITGNTFWNSDGSTANAVGLFISNSATAPCVITGNAFFGFNGSGATALIAGPTSNKVFISGNSFWNNLTGVALQSGVTNSSVVNNLFQNNTTSINNGGGGTNTITPNY